MIALDNVSLRAGTYQVVGLSLTLPSGCYGVLMGKTGSGKTTILEAIAGLKPVRSGRILLMGREVTHLPPAGRGVGYVPQDLALFPTMTVREHLAFAPTVRGWSRAEIAERVTELATLLGITSLLHRLPVGLSGGEAQRVALGRALAFRPPVLLLDEPLSALDDATRQEMYALLRLVQRQTGVTALHVTHSAAEAEALGDVLHILEGGRLIHTSCGTPPTLPSSPQ